MSRLDDLEFSLALLISKFEMQRLEAESVEETTGLPTSLGFIDFPSELPPVEGFPWSMLAFGIGFEDARETLTISAGNVLIPHETSTDLLDNVAAVSLSIDVGSDPQLTDNKSNILYLDIDLSDLTAGTPAVSAEWEVLVLTLGGKTLTTLGSTVNNLRVPYYAFDVESGVISLTHIYRFGDYLINGVLSP